MEKYCRARQATDGNTAHALCTLNTYGYRHTLRIRNTNRFSTATWLHERSTFYLVTGNQHSNNKATHRLQTLSNAFAYLKQYKHKTGQSAKCRQFIKTADNSCIITIITIIIIIIPAYVIPTLLQAQKRAQNISSALSRHASSSRRTPVPLCISYSRGTKWRKGEFR